MYSVYGPGIRCPDVDHKGARTWHVQDCRLLCVRYTARVTAAIFRFQIGFGSKCDSPPPRWFPRTLYDRTRNAYSCRYYFYGKRFANRTRGKQYEHDVRAAPAARRRWTLQGVPKKFRSTEVRRCNVDTVLSTKSYWINWVDRTFFLHRVGESFGSIGRVRCWDGWKTSDSIWADSTLSKRKPALFTLIRFVRCCVRRLFFRQRKRNPNRNDPKTN